MKEQIYEIKKYGADSSTIKARGYETRESMGDYGLLDRLREISEINKKENQIAVFIFVDEFTDD